VRVAFLTWGVGSTLWLINTFRTRGVDRVLLENGSDVSLLRSAETLTLVPATPRHAGLIFFTGGGVHADAYVPLLRPLAAAGFRVEIIRLPWRLAPLEQHKTAAIERAVRVIQRGDSGIRWVIAGHSLGGALAARLAAVAPPTVAAMVLIGTTHPKERNLSGLAIPVTKIYGTLDGVAPPEAVEANRRLLPGDTRWVVIDGGNHSQFGYYGSQLFDGTPTISRERQQDVTRAVLADALALADSALP
jgi:pimeloyl-ACP methyl ester carboxylesterase